jgi:hypothetical protein
MIRPVNSVAGFLRRREPGTPTSGSASHADAGRSGPTGRIIPSTPWLQFLAFFGLLAVLLVLVRGNVLWTSGLQNPDEAELMAEGRSAAADLFPYSGYTSSTHLFLWPFLLGLLDLVGIPLNLVTAHVIGGLSYVMLGTTGWFLMMRRIGGGRATLLVLPTTTALLAGYGPGTADFVSMTSESLPLVILCVAALVMLGSQLPATTRRLVVGSLVAGLAIWAKPQSGPVAAALVSACVVMACVEQHRAGGRVSRSIVVRSLVVPLALVVVAFVAPTVLFLGTMALGGTLDEFMNEPVAAMWGYTAHRDVTAGIVAPPLIDRLAGVASFATSFPLALAWALGGLVTMSKLTRLESPLLRALALTAFVLPLAATLVSLLPIFPLFPHYANFLYGGCLLATCVAVRVVVPSREHGSGIWVEGTYFGLAMALVGMLVLPNVSTTVKDLADESGRAFSGQGFSFHNEIRRDATPLGTLCPSNSRVEVWGWASELYAYYDWTPASRYANSTWLINPGPRQADYGSVLQGELRAHPPDCIVEATGPAFFASIDPANTLQAVVTGIAPLLESCYTRSEEKTFDDRAVILYRRTSACGG